mgnify:CR=1 FL=1
MAYTYRGGKSVPPVQATGFVRKKPVLKPCGTPAAYKRHLNHGELPCDACLESVRVYSNQRRALPPKQRGRVLKPCGTYTAFCRHKRLHQPIDDKCRAANREYCRDLRARKKESNV